MDQKQFAMNPDHLETWRKNLRKHRRRVKNDPQFLPVKQLAFEMSRLIEKGRITHDEMQDISDELCSRALLHRAQMTRERLGETDEHKVLERFRKLVRASTKEGDEIVSFKDFRTQWEQSLNGVVFTAHPTFLMSREVSHTLTELIGADKLPEYEEMSEWFKGLKHHPDEDLSLISEHEQVQKALAFAVEANRLLTRTILEVARETYRDDWTSLDPRPVELNSWVGYDMDGRNDIKWYDSIRFRLIEKQKQVERALAMIAQVCAGLGADPAVAHLKLTEPLFLQEKDLLVRHIELFAKDLDDPASLSRAANHLTQNKQVGLGGDLTRVMGSLEKALAAASTDEARMEIVLLRARFKAQGLGTARMHFRINASQLHNAARVPLKISPTIDLASRATLKKLDRLISQTSAKKVNFASLALERATAIRQFLVIAQILKHIDSTAPIRLLIAECETPFTVLGGIYLAKLYGVDDLVDVSPLLETEEALDHGARIISILMKTRSFRKYIKKRGRLCVQTGFSDAGRFIGQIPAALAIERFQGLLADVIARENFKEKIGVLIFDTHGESMGRGAHPVSLRDRFEYVMSPWTRWRYRSRQIPLHHEVSFQGGDGYVVFGSHKLALKTLVSMVICGCEGAQSEPDDLFYDDLDFSLDFFEHIKGYQTELFENKDYRDALASFGTGLLMKTGSRKAKRQFEQGSDNRNVVGEMRAIPHNAILQQMGYVMNVISGVGETLRYEHDRFDDVYKGSERLRRIMSLVLHARSLSSIKTLASYATLFDDAYWVTRPLNKDELYLKNPCIALADLLRGDRRHDGIMHLATYLREDAVRLHEVFDKINITASRAGEPWREGLDLMHALRIALIQHIYLLAAQIPQFSMANDISRKRVIGLIISFHIKEAVALMREVYPVSMPQPLDYDMAEEADDLEHQGVSYASIQRDLIDPIERTYELILEIGTGIAHNFGAHG